MHNEFVFFTHDKSKVIQFDDKKSQSRKGIGFNQRNSWYSLTMINQSASNGKSQS
jgi:hypothetical protein